MEKEQSTKEGSLKGKNTPLFGGSVGRRAETGLAWDIVLPGLELIMCNLQFAEILLSVPPQGYRHEPPHQIWKTHNKMQSG